MLCLGWRVQRWPVLISSFKNISHIFESYHKNNGDSFPLTEIRFLATNMRS